MPDRRQHRGPHPEDRTLFAPTNEPVLREAVDDLSLLLSRGYAETASLELVGNRFQLAQRQRVAVRRCACSDAQRERRRLTHVPAVGLGGHAVAVDAFNVLVTLEAALAGAVVLRGRDRCLRDMASMHGSWKRVSETPLALAHLLDAVASAAPASITFVLDRAVSNSGRLAARIRDALTARGLDGVVHASAAADRELIGLSAVVATADAGVLDRVARWTDLVGPVVEREVRDAWLLDLGAPA